MALHTLRRKLSVTTNEKIVKQGFELHGYKFYISGGTWVLDPRRVLTIHTLTDISKTISHVVGFGLAGNDSDDNT